MAFSNSPAFPGFPPFYKKFPDQPLAGTHVWSAVFVGKTCTYDEHRQGGGLRCTPVTLAWRNVPTVQFVQRMSMKLSCRQSMFPWNVFMKICSRNKFRRNASDPFYALLFYHVSAVQFFVPKTLTFKTQDISCTLPTLSAKKTGLCLYSSICTAII